MAEQDYGIAVKLDTSDANKNADAVGDSLRKVGTAADTTQGSVDKLSSAFKSVDAASQSAAQSGNRLYGTFTQLIGAATVFTAVGSVGGAVAALKNFEDSFAKLQIAMQLTSKQLDAVKQKSIDLSTQTSFSASKVAAGLTEMGKAGAGLQNSLEAIKPALDLATAAGIEVDKASKLTAQNITAGGVSVENIRAVNDQLFTASRATGGDVEKLAEVFAHVNPVLKEYGISTQDAVTVSALFTAEQKSGAEAAKDMSKSLQLLSDPTDNFSKAAKRLKIDLDDFDPKENTLLQLLQKLKENDTILDLDDKFKKLKATAGGKGKGGGGLGGKPPEFPEEFKSFASTQGITAFKSVNDLLSSTPDSIKKSIDDQRSGYSKLKETIDELRNSVENFVTSIGQSGGFAILSTIFGTLTAAIVGVTRLVVGLTPAITAVAIAMAVAFAPTAITIFIGLIGTATTAVYGWAAALVAAALANPFTAIAVAIAGAIGLLVSFGDKIVVDAKSGATLADVFDVVWKRIKDGAGSVGLAAKDAFQGVVNFGVSAANTVVQAFEKMVNFILGALQKVANFGNTVLTGIGGLNGAPAGQKLIGDVGKLDVGKIDTPDVSKLVPSGIMDEAAKNHTDSLKKETQAIDDQNKTIKAANDLVNLNNKLVKSSSEAHDKDAGSIKKAKDFLKEELDRLNDFKQSEERIKAINTLFDQGKISVDKYNDRLQELRAQVLKYDQTVSGGLMKGLNDTAKGFVKFGDDLGKVVSGAFNHATDAIVNFAKTGQFSFKSLIQSILEDVLKLLTNAAFGQFAQLLLGGFAGGKPGAAGAGIQLGGLFGSTGTGASGGGIFGSLGSLFGFATGGSFTVGGSGGTDTQLVAFKATPGEMVNVQTPQQQSSSGDNSPAAAAQQPANIRIVNNLDPAITLDAMSSSSGEQVVMNHITRNKNAIGRILGVA